MNNKSIKLADYFFAGLVFLLAIYLTLLSFLIDSSRIEFSLTLLFSAITLGACVYLLSLNGSKKAATVLILISFAIGIFVALTTFSAIPQPLPEIVIFYAAKAWILIIPVGLFQIIKNHFSSSNLVLRGLVYAYFLISGVAIYFFIKANLVDFQVLSVIPFIILIILAVPPIYSMYRLQTSK